MVEVEVIGIGPGAGAPAMSEVDDLCQRAAESRGVRDGHVAIEYVSERRIAELNARHRGKDEPTDVLSFPIDGAQDADALQPGVPRELGDIVICAAQTADLREAIVHGMLHLLGMDHESDDGEMLELQSLLLEQAS
jgi:probable rRNA maturation factor